jgi:predicted Zn-dependent peptidase
MMLRRLLILTVVAAATAVLSAQQAPDRTRPPQPGPPSALNLPAIQKRQLSNGLPVWIVELHDVPVAQVNLVVFSGTADDPSGKFGVASLAAAMLDEGAGNRSSLEIADAADFLGAALDVVAGIDQTTVRLHVPVARLDAALPIMADVALRPSFPPTELERVRRDRLTSILQARDDPATIDALAYARVLYGPAHRYGTATIGTALTVKSFTTDDLRAFHTAVFHPTNAALLIVGDVTPAKVMPLLESNFGGWKATGASAPQATLPPVEPPAERQIYLIDMPGAPQSQIRIGGIGVARSTPDYFPILILNTILGGSFSSRLNANLREQHGYTYGASSSFDMRAAAGPFVATAAVQTDKTADALKEFFNELARIRETVPAEELDRAKNYVARRFPGEFETTSQISGRLQEMLVYHLPGDYFSRYVQNIEAVTAADVRRAAERLIRPDRFVVVITGDRKSIEPAIRALNLGPIRVLTVDDVFGPAPTV